MGFRTMFMMSGYNHNLKMNLPARGGGGGPISESDSHAYEGDDEEDKEESSTKEELHASSPAEVD